MTMCVKCLDAKMIVMLLVMETSGRGLGAAARQFSHRQGIRYLVLWYSTIQCRVLYYSMWGAVVFNEWCSRSWCNVLWCTNSTVGSGLVGMVIIVDYHYVARRSVNVPEFTLQLTSL